MRILTAFLIVFLITSNGTAFCKAKDLNAREWADKLSDPKDLKNEAASSLYNTLSTLDSITVFDFFDKLNKEPAAIGAYYIARANCVKAQMIRHFNPPEPIFSPFVQDSIKRQITTLCDEAIRQAYITDDDYLAAYVSSIYGVSMNVFGNTEKTVMYMLYSAELYQKVGLYGPYHIYFVLGEILWEVREYEKSIYYTKVAIHLLTIPDKIFSEVETTALMMSYNTMGLAYHRLQLYDSAFYYYRKSLQISSKVKNKNAGKIWENIVLGNMAQIDFVEGKYSEALPLFISDYQSSSKAGVYDDAGNSLQWAAKTNLALGNKEEALQQIRESFYLLKRWPTAIRYRQNAYQTASEIFKSIGNNDSAYYYSGKYNLLHDSLEREIYQSSIGISNLRLANEKNRYNIQNLQLSKKEQLETRNYIIAAILLLFAIVLLLINRRRQKLKHKSEMDHAAMIRIQGEMESARAQMKMFTQHIVEKSDLIDKLESQIKNKLASEDEKELIGSLSQQTILTEEDWINFKMVFEKIYPQFFSKIIKLVNNITQAEQRMAALTLLHFTTRQMAGVLGISPNSVIKAKQRLRQRLNLQTDIEVEDLIRKL